MFFQIVSLADHLGNPRLGMKSEDSDYQGSSEKITFNFRPMVPIQQAMQEPLLQFLQLRSGLEVSIYNTLFSKGTQSGSETGKKLSASAFIRYPSSICIIYIILLFNGSYARNEVSTSKNVSMVNLYNYAFIHLIHIAYLHNNIASFYNDNNKFLNGRSKIKYCRGFGMNGVTLIYRAIIQTHSQAKKTRRNESHHSSSSCSQDMTSMDILTVAYFIN